MQLWIGAGTIKMKQYKCKNILKSKIESSVDVPVNQSNKSNMIYQLVLIISKLLFKIIALFGIENIVILMNLQYCMKMKP